MRVLQDLVQLGGSREVVEHRGQCRVGLVLAQLGAQLLDQQTVLVRVHRLVLHALQQVGEPDERQQFNGKGKLDDGRHADTRKSGSWQQRLDRLGGFQVRGL